MNQIEMFVDLSSFVKAAEMAAENRKRKKVQKGPPAGGRQRFLQYDGSLGGGEYVAGGYKGPQWQIRLEGF